MVEDVTIFLGESQSYPNRITGSNTSNLHVCCIFGLNGIQGLFYAYKGLLQEGAIFEIFLFCTATECNMTHCAVNSEHLSKTRTLKDQIFQC